MTSLADADLSQLVDEWLDWAEAAQLLGVTPAKVRTMIREHELAAAVPTPGAGPAGPRRRSSTTTGSSSRGCRGLLTVLHDDGYDDRECIAWLFLDADLPGPADRRAPREPRLGGQAACAGHGLLSPRPRKRPAVARPVLGGPRPRGAHLGAQPGRLLRWRPRRRRRPDAILPRVALASAARPRRGDTVALIDAGGPFPYDRDGVVFENRERLLPDEPTGYYHEYTVPTPGSSDRGARRIIDRAPAVSCTGPTTTTERSRGSPHERTGRTAGAPRRARASTGGTAPSRWTTYATPSSTPAGGSPQIDGWHAPDQGRVPGGGRARRCDFPDYYGQNFDALADCLADVTAGDSEGWVLLWDGWGPLAREDERAFSVALSVLGGRVNADKGGRFAVLLRGDGPDIEGVPRLD